MAHSNNNSIPSWMSDVKEDATRTNEWNELTRRIYDAVDQHLSQSHVSYFTDLSEAEKSLLLERAARSLNSSDGGKVYENLQSKLSYMLDQSVNNQVAKKLIEENVLETKTDLILDTTSEGVVSLLRKHPEQKYKLRVFLNQVIPQPIRFLAWQLFLANSNYRKIFINQLTNDPKSCLSPIDPEIQRKCESVLNSAVTFKEMTYSKGNLNSMKGLLSYYHTTILNRRNLNEAEYYYAIPIVYSHHPPLPINESPTERSIAILIEIYLQFVNTLPNGISQSLSGNNDSPEIESLIKTTLDILQSYDQPLLNHIRNLSKSSASSGIEEIAFQTAFKSICLPMMRNLYSGYLSLHPLMFVWDQYVISSDVTGFHEELIPIFTSIILIILRDQLMATYSIGEFDQCLKNQANYIQTRQLQGVFSKYFFKNLQTKLNSSTPIGPVIDPTVGRLQSWEHWHQDIVPRRTVRNREPNDTDERLQAEINKRYEAERAAQEEIERLRRELENMRNQPKQVIVQKQPTPRITPVQPKQTPIQPIQSARPPIRDPAIDFLTRMRESVNKIAHSEGQKRTDLNARTIEDLRLHKLDLKIAEKQIMGRHLGPNEWDSLSDKEKKKKANNF